MWVLLRVFWMSLSSCQILGSHLCKREALVSLSGLLLELRTRRIVGALCVITSPVCP